MFKVGAGDSLASVARQFAVDVDDVAHDNHLDVDAKLKEGSLLKVHVRSSVLEKASADEAPRAGKALEGAPAKDDAGDGKAKRRPVEAKHRKARHERG